MGVHVVGHHQVGWSVLLSNRCTHGGIKKSGNRRDSSRASCLANIDGRFDAEASNTSFDYVLQEIAIVACNLDNK
jgi:hypothetical protein